MAIPDYQALMLPILTMASDRKDHTLREAVETLAAQSALTEEEQRQLLPSGKQPVFENRVGWARTYLKKAGLLESPRRGVFHITPRGVDLLSTRPKELNVAALARFPEFVEFRALRHGDDQEGADAREPSDKTPEETLEDAFQKLRNDLSTELLSRVKACSPSFFERLVVDLLVAMGYGGSRADAGRAIGKSGDGGIDGIIKEDRLGLDIVYIQAKRWDSPVGRPEVQKFVGALQGHRARKGVLVTTATFTREAREYVSNIDNKVILIDGAALTQFMIEQNLGVSSVIRYDLKRIDSDYFGEE